MRRIGDGPFTDVSKYPDVSMSVNGLTCVLNLPPARESQDDGTGEEKVWALPPYNERPAFVVDEYPACPDTWMHGSAYEASYFVPVIPDHGLWLDFNPNQRHTHDVAVLISIQGVNAITGQPTEDFALEQYRENCPIHNFPFGHERYCEKCGYKWDAQNYLASNATPGGLFWLDGFRANDGLVRQFYFTQETMRGVAAQVIGDRRVFSIGIAFYLSKQAKPPPEPSPHSFGSSRSPSPNRDMFTSGLSFDVMSSGSIVEVPQIEIAAGARIDQRIFPDGKRLDHYEEKAAGIIYINYADVDTVQKILAAGRRDMTAKGEGWMKEIAVGKE